MRAGIVAVGHPVDVATGLVTSTNTDVALGGKIRLQWQRVYNTALAGDSLAPLGPGWTTRYFTTLTRRGNEYHLDSPAEGNDVFADSGGVLGQGGVVRNLATFQELSRRGDALVITRWNIKTADVDRLVFHSTAPGGPWHLTRIENARGDGLEIIRDRENRVVAVRQQLEQRTISLDYSPYNRIERISFLGHDGTRRVLVEYDYDNQGRLSAARDALGRADRYEYDAASRMVRELVKDGGVFTFRYDDRGRCIKASGLDQYDDKTFRYFNNIGWTWVTDSLGDVTRYEWLPTGQVIRTLNALGGEEETAFDEHGRVSATTAPDGTTVRYEYDERGNRPIVIDQTGARWQYTFNDRHELISSTDPVGRTWKYERDGYGDITVSEAPTGARSEYYWDASGNLLEVITPRGVRRSFKYDDRGVVVQVTNEAGRATDYTSDAFGRVTRVVSGPLTLTLDRDVLGRVVLARFEDGTTQTFVYDVAGNLSSRTDENGHTYNFLFGHSRRLLETTSPTGQSLKYIWGTEPERLDAILNEKGEEYRFWYDALGRLISERTFDNRESSFSYDAADRLIAYENAARERLTFVFDPCGRMVERHLPNGDVDRLSYDASGQLLAAETKDSSVRFALDPLGQIERVTQDEFVLENTFDVDGNRVGLATSLGHRATFDLNASAQLARLTLEGGESFTFGFDNLGRETSRLLPGNIRLDQAHDLMGRLVEQVLYSDGARSGAGHLRSWGRELMSRSYRHAPDGQLTGMKDSLRGDFRYQYDPEHRLLETLLEDRSVEQFRYDATGNIVSFASYGVQGHAHYAVGNRLEEWGSSRFSYDAQGRLSRRTDRRPDGGEDVWEFSWDAVDQLRTVCRPDGERWHYKYDLFGRRVAKAGRSGETRYVWDGDTIVHEVAPGRDATTWVYEPRSFTPLATLVGKEVFAVVCDQLAVPRELVSRRGAIVWSSEQSSWGQSTNGSRPARITCPIRFPGQWFDEESGLHYNRHRYYDPRIGRYISADPIGERGELNFYRYAINPLNFIDPLGLNVCDNKKKGDDFEDAVGAQLGGPPAVTVFKQVTVDVPQPGGGTVRTRADFVVRDNTKTPPTLMVIECKASPNAPYTQNQTSAGFPPPPTGTGQTGGTVAGQNAAGLPTIPPGTPVTTVRPGGTIPGSTTPAPTTYDPTTRTWT